MTSIRRAGRSSFWDVSLPHDRSTRARPDFCEDLKSGRDSIEAFLERVAGDDAFVTPISSEIDGHQPRNYDGTPFRAHLPASAIRSTLGTDVWSDFTTFCVERNPWDQLVSTYLFRREKRHPDLSCDDFLASRDFYRNHVQYTEDAKPAQVIVDHVLKYENLHDELGDIFSALGFRSRICPSERRVIIAPIDPRLGPSATVTRMRSPSR